MRFVGGPYDRMEVADEAERPRTAWRFSGLPVGFEDISSAADFIEDGSAPRERGLAVYDYFLNGAFETHLGLIAVYVYAHPSVRRRF